jgi:hypothetical protein
MRKTSGAAAVSIIARIKIYMNKISVPGSSQAIMGFSQILSVRLAVVRLAVLNHCRSDS